MDQSSPSIVFSPQDAAKLAAELLQKKQAIHFRFVSFGWM